MIASEVDAPEEAKPVVWRQLINQEVSTLEDAAEPIDWCRAHKEIKLLFLKLK